MRLFPQLEKWHDSSAVDTRDQLNLGGRVLFPYQSKDLLVPFWYTNGQVSLPQLFTMSRSVWSRRIVPF